MTTSACSRMRMLAGKGMGTCGPAGSRSRGVLAHGWVPPRLAGWLAGRVAWRGQRR